MAVYKIEGCQWNCYPDTTVPINKLDIRNQAEQEMEFVNVDFEFYKSLHKTLFGDLYD